MRRITREQDVRCTNDLWKLKKWQVRQRSGGICEKCGKRKAEHVHHLRYAQRRGLEPLEWLQHVCLRCHGDYHPHHTFRTLKEQHEIAQRRKAERKNRRPVCQHCGGTYPKGKHQSICVRYGLDR